MQINATLVKGKARVQFGANKVTDVISQLSACRSLNHFYRLKCFWLFFKWPHSKVGCKACSQRDRDMRHDESWKWR